MDLSKLNNPYDFANPISDDELFIGRKDELEEIKYYLDHAKSAPRPINIALLGPRASGKTSLLNMCEIEAKKRQFCAVRIDLDEGDAETQLSFFYKIFDGILGSICDAGAFGGKKGKTYDVYLDQMNTYVIPDDKTFCPFLFPLQYAKAMGSHNNTVQVSDNNFKADLIKIRSEVNHPIVLLFDEGNVLAKSRIHLEKLRNIFMNIPGFMIILTGTQDLFPIMDEVFSPIIRQFKKINVAGFKDKRETRLCIRKPLEKIGIVPEEFFDFETLSDVSEIHDLSGGRPYEIQLVCFKLFQRVQCKQSKKMKLSLSVLEDVRRELETSQDITSRPLITKIKNLSKNQLSALKLFCAIDGRANFTQIWTLEYISKGEKYWSKESLNKSLKYLVSEAIIAESDEIIRFNGDDFDRIYAKYYAREQEISLSFLDIPLELYWRVRLDNIASGDGKFKVLGGTSFLESNINILSLVKAMTETNADNDMSEEAIHLAVQIYELISDFRDHNSTPLLEIFAKTPWFKTQSWYYPQKPSDLKSFTRHLEILQSMQKRASEVGIEISIISSELPIIPIEELASNLEKSNNSRLMKILADNHIERMAEEYVDNKDKEEALYHAHLAIRYNKDLNPNQSNNLAYVFLSLGELINVEPLLKRAIEIDWDLHALSMYNFAILNFLRGEFKTSIEKLDQCIKESKIIKKEKRGVACLLLPINSETRSVKEILDPDLYETAMQAKEILMNCIGQVKY